MCSHYWSGRPPGRITSPIHPHHPKGHHPKKVHFHFRDVRFGLRITSVSNPHPQLVSGEQVLLRVKARSPFAAQHVRVFLNHQDVTSQFKPETPKTLLGLVRRCVRDATR